VSSAESTAAGAITLDQLIALNDEIAALVRVGVPLEQGLGLLGGDLPGRLGKIASSLAAELQRGKPLQQALEEPALGIPPVYRAVVVAGLRSGRLASALESVAASARRLAEARRTVAAAAIYPLIVVLVAWCLFLVYVLLLAPRFLGAFEAFHVPGRETMATLAAWGASAQVWGPLVPLAAVLVVGTWWALSGRATVLGARVPGGPLRWVPGLRSIVRYARTAAFSELAALLVENRVPLDEAVLSAAEATGDRELAESARRFADAVRRGQVPSWSDPGQSLFPPTLAWMMAAGSRQGDLAKALRYTADVHRRRLLRGAQVARVMLPVCFTVTVGGTATLIYVLLVFVPWLSLLASLLRM